MSYLDDLLEQYQGDGQPDQGVTYADPISFVPDGSGSNDGNGEFADGTWRDDLGNSGYTSMADKIMSGVGGTMDWLTGANANPSGAPSPGITALLPAGAITGKVLSRYGDNGALPGLSSGGGIDALDPTGSTAPGARAAAGDFGAGGNLLSSGQSFNIPPPAFSFGGVGTASNIPSPASFGIPSFGTGPLDELTRDFGNPDAGGFSSFVPDISALNADIGARYSSAADQLDEQLAGLDFGPLLDAQKAVFANKRSALQQNRDKTLGDVKGMFARNQVLGSSLAAGSIASATKEFEKQEQDLAVQEAQTEATTKLQAIDARVQLMQKAADTRVQGIQAQMDNLYKVASFGQTNAQLQVQLKTAMTDMMKGLMAAQASVMQSQIGAAASEAASYRNALVQLQNTQVSGDTAKEVAKIEGEYGVGKQNAANKGAASADIGKLLTPIATPILSGIGEKLAGSFGF